MNGSEIDKIKRFLSEKRKIVIIPHKNPDGDAIGSSTALKYYLDNFNHNVDIISPNQFPEFLKWMDPSNPKQVSTAITTRAADDLSRIL